MSIVLPHAPPFKLLAQIATLKARVAHLEGLNRATVATLDNALGRLSAFEVLVRALV